MENPPAPLDPQPATPPPVSAPTTALPPASPPSLKPPTSHGRTGKVARLPKSVRDDINTMIQDGVPYLQIINDLGPQAQGITEANLSNWKSGGYLDWLRENQLTQALHAKYELAQSIISKASDDNAAGQAILQTIALNLCEFLTETDPATLRENLLSDADKFTRFVNSMVRLAEGGIKCQMLKFRTQDRAEELARRKAPAQKPGISDEALHTAEEKLKLL